MKTNNTLLLLTTIGLAILNFGCTAINTFPTAAYPGQTVALAVGSAENLTRANINSVTFTPANPGLCDFSFPITDNVRSVFKLYADKTSPVYTEGAVTGSTQLIRTSLHEPWITVMAVDLPEDCPNGEILPAGPATITINTNVDEGGVSYPAIAKHINDTSIGIEILPEASPTDIVANKFEYEFGKYGNTRLGELSLLEPSPHVLISSEYSDDPFTLPNYAAIEMKVDFAGKTIETVTDDNLKVVVDDLTTYTKSNRNIITSVNNEVLTVIITSLNEQLKPYEMRFAAVLLDGTNTFTDTPSIISTKFYDINGMNLTDLTLFTAEVR
jgi:hypothetical protein